MTGKLSIDSSGRLKGSAVNGITYNSPWPCPNGHYGMGQVHGVIMHTMVGNLPGTTSCFNNASFQASAHFGVDQSGHIHQFGPVDNWVAWHVAAGNPQWIGIEFADDANPNNALTDKQLTAGAQIVEAVFAKYNLKLQVTNSVSGWGLGVHYMGGAAWGGHSCPDTGGKHVRSSQRGEVIRRAQAIRSGNGYASNPPRNLHVLSTAPNLVHFAWDAASGAKSYDVQAWTGGKQVAKTWTVTGKTDANAGKLNPGVTYTIFVKANPPAPRCKAASLKVTTVPATHPAAPGAWNEAHIQHLNNKDHNAEWAAWIAYFMTLKAWSTAHDDLTAHEKHVVTFAHRTLKVI
ncbi:MAG: N-acetylmuramoyl-L-alanine amidase [Micromonosporaceae bacterium]